MYREALKVEKWYREGDNFNDEKALLRNMPRREAEASINPETERFK